MPRLMSAPATANIGDDAIAYAGDAIGAGAGEAAGRRRIRHRLKALNGLRSNGSK
jgi:hypothetical protein